MENNNLIKYKFQKINKKKIIDVVSLIFEAIFAIILGYALYKISYFKTTSGIWPKKYLVEFFPSAIIVIGTIIYNCKFNREKVEKIFLSFLIPVAMCYVFFMAPSYVPDENVHIWKAYEVSTGQLITKINPDGQISKMKIPAFFVNNSIQKIKSYSEFQNAQNEETDYNDTVEVDNSAQGYISYLYIISGVAFFIGRMFSINGIIVIYLARILNLIVFLIAGYYSIKIIPFGKKTLGVIMFLPITLQQAASVSADSILNSISILFIAYTMYLYTKKDSINIKHKIIYTVMAILISMAKIAYVPIVALSALFWTKKNENKKKITIFIVIVVLLSIISALGWFKFMQKYPESQSHQEYINENDVNASMQIKEMIKNPGNFLEALKNIIEGGFYLNSTIGSNLGWLNIVTPVSVVYIFIMLLVLSPFMESNKSELGIKEKIWVSLIFIGTFLVIIMAMYVTWTPVGDTTVKGVQGRYFIPILALPLLVCCGKNKKITNTNISTIIVPMIAIYLNYISLIKVIEFFK